MSPKQEVAGLSDGAAALVGVAAVGGIVIGVGGGLLLLGVLTSCVDAWVFVRLWRWFATALGAPPIGYWLAFGLLTLIRAARPQEPHADREGQGKQTGLVWLYVGRITLYPALVLGFGRFAHAMMVHS